MVRAKFAGRPGDSIVSLFSLGRRQVLALPADANGDPTAVTLTVWDAPDGTQLTDLLAADASTAIEAVVVPVGGQIPEFYGPDGVLEVYLRDPEGDFTRIDVGPQGPAGVADDPSMAAIAADGGSAFRGVLSGEFAPVGAIDHGNTTGALTVDAATTAVHELVLTGNVTITPSGPPGCDVLIYAAQDVTGGRTLSFDGVTMPDGWSMPATGNTSVAVALVRGSTGWRGFPLGVSVSGTPIPVTPTAPTFTDVSGTASDTYTIPTQTGVIYKVDGLVKDPGVYAGTGTVTITAEAASNYVLVGTVTWSRTYDTSAMAPFTVTRFQDLFTRANGFINGTAATSGQTYTASTIAGSIASNKYQSAPTKNAIVSHGSGVSDLLLHAEVGPATDLKIAAKSAITTNLDTDPFGPSPGFRVWWQSGVPRLLIMLPADGLTMTYNANLLATDTFAIIPGGSDTTVHTIDVQIVSRVVSVYVDGTRLLEGIYSSVHWAALAGESLVIRGTGLVDNVELKLP